MNPNEKLALWDLGILYAMLQQPDRSIAQLQKLVALDPGFPDALTALGTIQTMRARGLFMNAKRQAKLRAEDQEWIADESSRSLLRTTAGGALEEAQQTLQRARAANNRAPEPPVFLNLVLRMKAEMADDLVASKDYIHEADQLARESLILRQQQGPPAKASGRLDANSPPPPFPKPGTPPPPPPR